VAHIGRHNLEVALAVSKSGRAWYAVIGHGRLQNTPIGLINDTDGVRHGVACLVNGRARKQPVMYGLLRCRIDEHGTKTESDKVRADSGPSLTRQEIHAGVVIGTRTGRKLVVVLNDSVVTLLGNDEECIRHFGVLDGLEGGWRLNFSWDSCIQHAFLEGKIDDNIYISVASKCLIIIFSKHLMIYTME